MDPGGMVTPIALGRPGDLVLAARARTQRRESAPGLVCIALVIVLLLTGWFQMLPLPWLG